MFPHFTDEKTKFVEPGFKPQSVTPEPTLFFIFPLKKKIEVYLIYSVMLVSGIQ